MGGPCKDKKIPADPALKVGPRANPSKKRHPMANNLARRIGAFEALSSSDKASRRKPGSLNRHK